ncbi:MAG: hypothetical protein Q4D91_02975 [Lautropia sp.]|nr:hypothetical protein [Lautropia sp.]
MNAIPTQFIALTHLKQHWAEPRHLDERTAAGKTSLRLSLARWFAGKKA